MRIPRVALRSSLLLALVASAAVQGPVDAQSSGLAVTVQPTSYGCEENGKWRVTVNLTIDNSTGAPRPIHSVTYTIVYRDRDIGEVHTADATIHWPNLRGQTAPEGMAAYSVSTSGWYDYAVPEQWPRCEYPLAMRVTIVTDTMTGLGEGEFTEDLRPDEIPVPMGQLGMLGLAGSLGLALVLAERRRSRVDCARSEIATLGSPSS